MIYFLLLTTLNIFSQELKVQLLDLSYREYTMLAIDHINKSNDEISYLSNINTKISKVPILERKEIIENSIQEKILDNDLFKKDIFSISTGLLKRVSAKIKDNKDIYTKFTIKVIESILNDYEPYYKAGFINRYQSFSRNNPEEVKMYTELINIIKLTSHMLHYFLENSAKDFNDKISILIKEALILATQKSYYLETFSLDLLKDSNKPFIKITTAQAENLKIKKDTPLPQTLKDAVEDLDSNVLEGASSLIDEIQTDK